MGSDSGKKQLVPGMACATTNQRTSNNVPLAALCEKLCRPKYLALVPAVFNFVQLKFVWEKLQTRVTFASPKLAMTNSDRLTELTLSFLLVYRYLDFDYN